LFRTEQEELKWFIEMNQKAGKICPSTSLFTLPFFFRLKLGTGELWGIQDYRRLNKVVIKDHYPLPLISKVIMKVTNSSCFTKMDLR
jgi:hypothetical protein